MDNAYSIIKTPTRERGKHLNFEDRCTIKVLHKLGYSLRQIAAELNCSPSTVMNELRRGTGKRNGDRGRFPEYSPKRGQQTYNDNRSRCGRSRRFIADNPFVVWAINEIKSKKSSI